MTVEDIRWGRCDIKSVNLLANVLARQRAKEAGAFEAILVRERHGHRRVCEQCHGGAERRRSDRAGRATNSVRGDACDCSGAGEERRASGFAKPFVSREDMLTASEVFLTGTTVEVLPVVGVDGQAIGDGIARPCVSALVSPLERIDRVAAPCFHYYGMVRFPRCKWAQAHFFV